MEVRGVWAAMLRVCIEVHGGAWMCVVVSVDAWRRFTECGSAVRCIVALQCDAVRVAVALRYVEMCGGACWCEAVPGDAWLFAAVHCGAWHC